ncbi:hypothetical protein AK812_SmicGene28153 [Symbiodinium microadriaticum]|uniref:Uncharacterized protein n=1 Tax=Symbiodinium microadriaticum TaxID=2951 RepID=A0A1Q9D518_SYMMI|nr:hypothetical protein AK812_SmicGene28153 [Symbiodinium microadriaticum]
MGHCLTGAAFLGCGAGVGGLAFKAIKDRTKVVADQSDSPEVAEPRPEPKASSSSAPPEDDEAPCGLPGPTVLPPLQRQPCESTTSTTTPDGSSGLFRLAPPPPPVNQFSVGSRTPAEQVVKFETLQEAKPATSVRSKAEEEEAADFGPTGAVFVDDEESLLGAVAQPQRQGKPRPADLYDDVLEEEDATERKYSVQVTPPHEEEAASWPPPTPLHVASEEAIDQAEPQDTWQPAREVYEEVAEEEAPEATANAAAPMQAPTSPKVALSQESSPSPSRAQQAKVSFPTEPEVVEEMPPPPAPAPAFQESKEVLPPPMKEGDRATAALALPTPEVASSPVSEGSPASVTPGQMQSFRICVPDPYPGVQIRKSPNLKDKHNRFLQDGKFVTGTVDKDGQWVKLSGKHYLPVKVQGIQVLYPVDPQDVPQAQTPPPNSAKKAVEAEAKEREDSPPPPPQRQPVVQPLPVSEPSTGYWPWTCCTGQAVSLTVTDSNDLHVHPPETAAGGSGETGSNLLTPIVVTNSAQAGHGRPAEAPKTMNVTGLKNLKMNAAEGFGPAGVSTLPRHISNPIDPFSDR